MIRLRRSGRPLGVVAHTLSLCSGRFVWPKVYVSKFDSTSFHASTRTNGHIWRGLCRTFRLLWYRERPRLVGTDDQGNRFFEAAPNIGSEYMFRSKKSQRFVLIPGQKTLEDEWIRLSGDLPNVSPEWASWLRHRRSDPPTADEIAANKSAALRRAALGTELETKYEAERAELIKQGLLHENSQSSAQAPHGDVKTPFPSHPELELVPGMNPMNSDKKP